MVLVKVAATLQTLAVVASAADQKLVLLPEAEYGSAGGRCLDGTMAGYYYGAPPSGDSSLVVINIEGGGGCNSKASCEKWMQKEQGKKGGSAKWPATQDPLVGVGKKIMSDDKSENPDFFDAHHIHVPYCTGDGHAGQVVTPSSETFGYYFDGHLNFKHIVDHLVKTVPSFKSASRILLFGESAGGIGVIVNCDFLQDLLTTEYNSPAKVSCAPLSGWFVPGFTEDQSDPDLPPSDYSNWAQGKTGGDHPDTSFEKTYLNPACTSKKDDKDKCHSATVVYPYIKAPMFVMQHQFDANQIFTQFGLPKKTQREPTEQKYIGYFGRAMRNSTQQVLQKKGDGVFLASCLNHGVGLRVGDPDAIKIKGYTSAEALGDWFFGRGKVPSVLFDDCQNAQGLPCNPTCPPDPHNPPAPGPSPPSPGPSPPSPPGPSPSPGSCKDELMKDCGAKMSSKRECAQCAKDHETQLGLAGCTRADVVAFCTGSEETVVV